MSDPSVVDPPSWRDAIMAAVVAALTAVLGLRTRAARRKTAAGDEVLLATLQEKVLGLEDEVKILREFRHASELRIASIAMLPELMKRVRELEQSR